jgi:hypothetical protein
MDVDLFIKKMPQAIKDLISREASNNRRSINQEAIALLEEALLRRVESPDHRRRSARAILEGAAASAAPAATDPDTTPGELTTLLPAAGGTPAALPHKLAH